MGSYGQKFIRLQSSTWPLSPVDKWHVQWYAGLPDCDGTKRPCITFNINETFYFGIAKTNCFLLFGLYLFLLSYTSIKSQSICRYFWCTRICVCHVQSSDYCSWARNKNVV